ncbi:hypothetical protein HDU85_002905 [Gaertneriomyces sp. JEL0708]|nr:hypothetical protein HDU85_002905 [Gaertneriomyces sp. JEL0708]
MLTNSIPAPTPIVEPTLSDIEKSFKQKEFKVSPPLPPPRTNLDARSFQHLQQLIRQTLNEVYVHLDPWEKVLTEVALEVAQDVPYVVEIMGRRRGIYVRLSDATEGGGEKREMTFHHRIRMVLDSNGKPEESRYVPGTGREIYKGDFDAVCAKDSRLLDLGGTVILKGTVKVLRKLEKVVELLVFVVCNLKLEMHVFRDHFAERPEIGIVASQSSDDHFSLGHIVPKRVGRSLWNWIRGEDSGTGSHKRSSSPDGVLDGSNRFDRAIKQIEKTIISASPDVVFPPPHLLLRLREEENQLHAQQQNADAYPGDSDDRRVSYFPEDADFPITSGSNRGGKFGSWSSLSETGRRDSNTSVKTTSSRTSHISVDSKAGLGYLMTNNNSISGVMKHQSITFAYSYYLSGANIPCQPPQILSIEYYQTEGDHFQDRTLGQFVQLLCAKANGLCPDSMCGKPMGQHVVTYTHNRARISVSVQPVSNVLANSSVDSSQIYMWTGCRDCDSSTDVLPMSDATWHYSFAKFLELLYYNPSFVCTTLCSHMENRQSVRRFFRLRDQIVMFDYDPIDLFEMRVPKIQVCPDHFFDDSAAAADLDCLLDDSHDQNMHPFGIDGAALIDETRLEITCFYGSVKDFVQALGLSTGSTLVAQNEGTTDQVRCQIMLDDLSKKFKEEEQEFYQMLKNTRTAWINNLRRFLRKRMREIVEELSEWRKDYASECKQEPKWDLPDYCPISNVGDMPRCHVFPNSFVIIRDDEPTSIIAFTLTSKDYIRQVRDLAVLNVEEPFTPPAPVPIPQWAKLGEDCEVKVKVFSHELQSPGSSNNKQQHIKYKIRDGKHSFSCTAYYAAQFDALRRKCGMSAIAGFFKTHDDQLVVKQLASKFTNQEKAALLKFAPAYFEYMSNSDRNPTILVKIFGFYTIKRKNLQTGAVMKLDVLVMEHLFANVKISRKFDLKGVPDRHIVSKKDVDNDVMWDGDWVDGRYKQLLRLHAHSKKIILESVYNDTEFLSNANIMDYSLLVGVNDDKKELVVGIVDFIGPYTWYKILETRAKTTLNAALKGGKDVTVIPPDMYRDRFRKAMDQNFLMVPDKWIKIPALENPVLPGNGSITPLTAPSIFPSVGKKLPPVL